MMRKKSLQEERQDDYEQSRYDDYLNHRAELVQAEMESARSFDKYLVTLASGALVLSVTFLEKVATQPAVPWQVCVAWYSFAGCLFVTLLSFLASQWAFRCEQTALDQQQESEKHGNPSARNLPSVFTHWLNILSLLLFAVGLIFASLFVTSNIKAKGAEMRKTGSENQKPIRIAVTEGTRPGKPPVSRPKPQQDTGQGKKD